MQTQIAFAEPKVVIYVCVNEKCKFQLIAPYETPTHIKECKCCGGEMESHGMRF